MVGARRQPGLRDDHIHSRARRERHPPLGREVVLRPQRVQPEPFQFAVISVLKYAGNGQWSLEEDVYNAKEAEKVVLDYFTAKGDVAPFDLGPSTPA